MNLSPEAPWITGNQNSHTTISFKNITFGFGENLIFDRFSLELGDENPVLILGPSGCGKTTLLRLGAGLVSPWSGDIACSAAVSPISCSLVFQEPRLLPWFRVLENVVIPLKALLPRRDAEERARHFLELVALQDKAEVYPEELSGGQRQRASIARAFAYPSQILFMDEPFQSLDIPLRIELMDMTLSLLKAEPRLCIAVTHDPREALMLGRRIIVLGNPPRGSIFDEKVRLPQEEREYSSVSHRHLERRLLDVLQAENRRPLTR